MNVERDKFLTEKMGLCWHEEEEYYHKDMDNDFWSGMRKRCSLCHSPSLFHINFDTWEGFGVLWEWAQKQEWFWLFALKHIFIENSDAPFEPCDWDNNFPIDLINPTRFADALAEFLLGFWRRND